MEMRIIKVKMTMHLNHFLNNQASKVKLATIRKPIFPVCKVRTGKLDAQCAMSAIAPAGKRINQINTEEMNEAKGEKIAAIKPTIVIGATKGAANKLAIMLIGARYPESATMMGEQKTVAAIGGDRAWANLTGI
jgi:hypothetical protein